MQIRIHDLCPESENESASNGEPLGIIVHGSSPDGLRVYVLVQDAATTCLVRQLLQVAGHKPLRARLEAQPCFWTCVLSDCQEASGSLRARVRDGLCVLSLCEQVRSAVFEPGRGEPILVGFPPWQGEGYSY